MRNTVDIPDDIYRELKIKAAREGKPVRQIVLNGIQRELQASEKKPTRRMNLPVIRSSRPGTLKRTNEQIDELTAFS